MDDNKIKIIHIASGDLYAGAEALLYNLIEKQSKNDKLSVRIILLNSGVLADKISNLGIEMFILSESQDSFFTISKKINTYLKTYKPQIIHTHRYKENILGFLAKGFKRSIKLVATQHGLVEISTQVQTLLQKLKNKSNYQILSIFFNQIVAVSFDIKELLIENHAVVEKKITVIRNGIKIPPSDAISLNKSVNFHIGSAGRLTGVKDFMLFINIATEVIKKDNDIIFHLAGTGPLMTYLKNQTIFNKIEKYFIFEGELKNMSDFYSSLDLYINTSIHEGIPMTILEAMSFGIPVIAPKVGGIPEIITHEKDGFLMDYREAKVFADKILALKSNKKELKIISKNTREKVIKLFSVDKMENEYFHLYMKCLRITK